MIDAPSCGAPEHAPRWDLVDTESCGGGIRFLAHVLIIWGTCVYIGGRSTSVEHRGAHEVGGAPYTPRHAPTLVGPSKLHRRTSSSYIPTYPHKIRYGAKTLIPPPQLSISTRSHLGACSGAPPERAVITKGFYIIIDSPMKCE